MNYKNIFKNTPLFKTTIILVAFLFIFIPVATKAGRVEEIDKLGYPKIANYFLAWSITSQNVEELAKWDVLILDMENQNSSQGQLKELRNLNPNIVILAYTPSQEIFNKKTASDLRNKILTNINDSFYLRDKDGNKLSFWPGTNLINITNSTTWSQIMSNLITDDVLSTNLWDGVFYDNGWDSISWFNNGNIDADNNRVRDNGYTLDKRWEEGMKNIFRLTREKNNDAIILANSTSNSNYHQYLNGRMFENFSEANWINVIPDYITKFPSLNRDPQIIVINSNSNNTGVMNDYKKMRFGLTSTLLGNGYYSFDFGDQSHTQTWWYDEYDTVLGQAQNGAYNLLDRDSSKVKPGLWRRDFEQGISIVNSTDKEQIYVFNKESFEKINGEQDRRTNNGIKINWIKIPSKDGVILLKINTEIINSNYSNGHFVRVFDSNGKQERNGFFSFEDAYKGNSKIVKTDLDSDGSLEVITSYEGKISIFKNGKIVNSFYPYTENFKKDISFAVEDLNNDGQREIITGAGLGGGPHVRIFNQYGKVLGQFFAYNKNFRGGVNIAVGDMDNDGLKEIITGAGIGGGPHVRIFNQRGEVLGQFFAFNANFSGGVSVAVGDINKDGKKEIITGAGPGGNTEIRIFSRFGHQIKSFLAYEDEPDIRINVIANDIDDDGYQEILVSTDNF